MAELTGAELKAACRAGNPKMGLFINSHSPTAVEQLAHSGYDWLLVDTQHGPMDHERLSAMLCAIGSGGAKSMVRVEGYHDRGGIQQALDLGSDGVLVPYINTPEEATQEILSNVVDGAGQAARCSISSPSLNFFPSKTWTISSEPLSLRQRASA